MLEGFATFPQDHQLLVGWALIIVVILLIIWLCVITGVFAKKEHMDNYELHKLEAERYRKYMQVMREHHPQPFVIHNTHKIHGGHLTGRHIGPTRQNSSIIDPLFITS